MATRFSRVAGRVAGTLTLVAALLLIAAPSACATGAKLVRDINPGKADSYPGNMAKVGSGVFFAARGGHDGYELWRSDGTRKGTKLVRDIRPHGGRHRSSNPEELTNVSGTAFFNADDGKHGPALWRSNGTRKGTKLVRGVTIGYSPSDPDYGDVRSVGLAGSLVFGAEEQDEPWVSDGTRKGTKVLRDIRPGSRGSFPSFFEKLGRKVFFSAWQPNDTAGLWRTDGSRAGTKLVRGGYTRSLPDSLTNVNGTLFFAAFGGARRRGLWRSDGTRKGTKLVRDIDPGPTEVWAALDRKLIFGADDGKHGYELWRSNGTRKGTKLVRDIAPGRQHSYPADLTKVGRTVFFRTFDSRHGKGLWRTDGSRKGTKFLRSFRGSHHPPMEFRNVNGTLFFSANQMLWRSDGTQKGTRIVRDKRGKAVQDPHDLTAVSGKLFFRSFDSAHGYELWKVAP